MILGLAGAALRAALEEVHATGFDALGPMGGIG